MTADSALHLDSQLCFLVYRLHRGITDLYRPVLNELGLTYPQYLVMLVLWEGRPVSVRQLGERLDLDSGTLSPLVKRLEAAGLVVRMRSADDERSVDVSLTEKGRRLRSKAARVPQVLAGCLGGTAEDYHRIREQLAALVQRVDAARPS